MVGGFDCSAVAGPLRSVFKLRDGLATTVGISSAESVEVGGVGRPLSGLILTVFAGGFGLSGWMGTMSSSVGGRSRCIDRRKLFSFVGALRGVLFRGGETA